MIRHIIFLIFAVAVLRCHGDNVQLENNSLDGGIEGRNRVTQINLNQWFDRSLPLIKKYMVQHGMEPMSLPGMSVPVPNIPGFKPKIKLDNGWIHGTSNITRSGDIIQRVYENSWQVDSQLNWKHVELKYPYSLKYLFFKNKGALTGTFLDLNMLIMGSIDFKTRKVELRQLRIVDAGDFSLKLSGHLADPIANAAIRTMSIAFRKRMLREMEHQINISAQLKVDEVNSWLANHPSIPIPNLTELDGSLGVFLSNIGSKNFAI